MVVLLIGVSSLAIRGFFASWCIFASFTICVVLFVGQSSLAICGCFACSGVFLKKACDGFKTHPCPRFLNLFATRMGLDRFPAKAETNSSIATPSFEIWKIR